MVSVCGGGGEEISLMRHESYTYLWVYREVLKMNLAMILA